MIFIDEICEKLPSVRSSLAIEGRAKKKLDMQSGGLSLGTQEI